MSAGPPERDLAPEAGNRLARYLTQKGHYSRPANLPTPRAFLPAPETGETSVFLIDGLDEESIWAIAENHIVPTLRAGRRIHGRADVPRTSVEIVGLRLVVDNDPPRHANVVGWPAEKDEQLSLAQELIQSSEEQSQVPLLRLL